ncbi:MAG: hypothetical protein HVN35_02080 [Methanobacteriaceae archaeon]|nr:hypothetical protein [Methanobacteriaceae archaeon]
MKILKRALEYVHQREHEGGGFTLYEGIPDGKNTYYGLLIMKMFNETPYNIDKTIKWVEDIQKGYIFGVYGKFNLVNILNLLGKKPEIADKYIHRLSNQKEFPNLETAYLSTVILHLTGHKKLNNIAEWILSHQNEDGGFGKKNSNITLTQYALESLNIINRSLIRNERDIINFTNNCRTDEGIFAYTPNSYPPYIEAIYSGIRIHEILDVEPEYPDKIINHVVKLQNNNGGFRRSIFLGISELEYTFKALYILKSLSYL